MLAVALLALALYTPGLTLYPPSDASHAVFRVAVCLAVAQGIGVPRGRLVRWGLGLWAVGIVSSVILAPDPWRAMWSTHNRNEGAWQVSHYIGLMLVACATPRERLVRWVAIAAGLTAAWGVLPLGWVNGRLAGSTGNPLYLAPLLLVGVWGAWRAGQPAWTQEMLEGLPHRLWRPRRSWQALGAVLALAAALTGSKGVVVAAVAAGGVLVLAKAPRWAIVAAGAILAAGIWLVPIGGSALIRLELGRVALAGIAAEPWGWGAEGFPFVWDEFWRGVTATGEVWHDRAHSLVLDRAVEWGVVGVAGWLAVVVAAWRRAELPERMAIAAYLGYSLTMFEMMWGAAGFASLLGYVLRGQRWTPSTVRGLREAGVACAAVALVVGAAQLSQSWAGAHAADHPAMQRAIERWSPIGGDLIEVFLKAPQTRETLQWADDHVETRSPHATQQAFLLAIWDRSWCVDLRMLAPKRPDVRFLCGPRPVDESTTDEDRTGAE